MNASLQSNGQPVLWTVTQRHPSFRGKHRIFERPGKQKPFEAIRQELSRHIDELRQLEQDAGVQLIKVKVKDDTGMLVLVEVGPQFQPDYGARVKNWFYALFGEQYGPIRVRPYLCCMKDGGCGSCFINNPKNQLDVNG
jgi:hypothetical protein